MKYLPKQQNNFKGTISRWYVFLLFTVFPLAVHYGYTDILQTKTNIFYVLTGTYIFLICCTLVQNICKKSVPVIHFHGSGSDYSAAGLFAVILFSWMLCTEKRNRFIGLMIFWDTIISYLSKF